jgi:putative NADH-flavin reductase
MRIAVIGATGMVGGALTAELLLRGHEVTAIARNAGKLAEQERLTPRSANVLQMDQLAPVIADHDAVISAYSPGGAMGPQVYKDIIESSWKIKRVFKQVSGQYLLTVGGASSLWGPSGTQMFEDPRWPAWYFNAASPEHLRYLKGMTGVAIFEELAQARQKILDDPARDPFSDWTDAGHLQFIARIAANHDKGEAGRAQLEFFTGDVSFRWSYCSPPWFMRPGPRTGQYSTVVNQLPMDGARPAGISVADLAVALADEVHSQAFVHAHWSAASAPL